MTHEEAAMIMMSGGGSKLQKKEVTLTGSSTIKPDKGYDGMSEVKVTITGGGSTFFDMLLATSETVAEYEFPEHEDGTKYKLQLRLSNDDSFSQNGLMSHSRTEEYWDNDGNYSYEPIDDWVQYYETVVYSRYRIGYIVVLKDELPIFIVGIDRDDCYYMGDEFIATEYLYGRGEYTNIRFLSYRHIYTHVIERDPDNDYEVTIDDEGESDYSVTPDTDQSNIDVQFGAISWKIPLSNRNFIGGNTVIDNGYYEDGIANLIASCYSDPETVINEYTEFIKEVNSI